MSIYATKPFKTELKNNATSIFQGLVILFPVEYAAFTREPDPKLFSITNPIQTYKEFFMITLNYDNRIMSTIGNKILRDPTIIPEELNDQANLCAKVHEFVYANDRITSTVREITPFQNRILDKGKVCYSKKHPLGFLHPQTHATFDKLLQTYPALKTGRLIRKVDLQKGNEKEATASFHGDFTAENDFKFKPVPIKRSYHMIYSQINHIENMKKNALLRPFNREVRQTD